MKRSSLLLLTLFALSVAALLLPHKARGTFPKSTASIVSTRDPYLTPAAMRWRQGQHAHWRACMLQH